MLVVVGPTASGKSALAVQLARLIDGAEIVSADSMVVYRGMDLGTAKPDPATRASISHHLIDLADPWEEFSVAEFQSAATEVLDSLSRRKAFPLVVGGTGLYVRAVVDGLAFPGRWPEIAASLDREAEQLGVEYLHRRLALLDPLAASRMLVNNRRRVVRALEVTLGSGKAFSSFGPGLTSYPAVAAVQVGLDVSFEELDRRIEERISQQIQAGWLDEVRRLEAGQSLSRTASQALGYKELLAHLEGEVSLDQAVSTIAARTRAFARRQRSWFRRDPRIRWVDAHTEAPDLLDLLQDCWR